MISLYAWPRGVCYAITFLFDLCVVAQTLALVLCFLRQPRNRSWLLQTLLETLVLAQALTCSALHGQAIQGYITSLVFPTGYAMLRVAVFAALALVTLTLGKSTKKHLPILAAAFLTLPMMEKLGRSFVFLFLAALLFYLIRGIRAALRYYMEIKSNLSALSVKESIDSMRSGILFCERDGYILLSNTQMETLIKTIFGTGGRRNAIKLYERLMTGDIDPVINIPGAACQTVMFEGQVVCLLPGGTSGINGGGDTTAWMFTRTELGIGRRNYVQISAADITERWRLTEQLQAKAGELRQRNEALKTTIENLYSLSRERETQQAKWRAHDVLGQSLALLLRGMRGGIATDYKQLLSVSRGFLDSLQSGGASPNPRDEFESLKQSFASIGVEIRLEGELPSEGSAARLFLEIIREAVTNAVRHGFATLVTISSTGSVSRRPDTPESGPWHMCIRDNGRPSAAPLVEGGGLGGIRQKLAKHGGSLELVTEPGFVLRVEIPGESDA